MSQLLAATESLGNCHNCGSGMHHVYNSDNNGYAMSCDPDVQYKIVLILQSDWTRLYAGALHKLIYDTFPDSP